LFSPGQPARLVVPDGEGLCYSSGWVHGETEDTLEVDAPRLAGRLVSPPVNAAVRVTVTGGDGIYSFNTRVQRSGGDLLVLAKPDIIERHQRRRAPRVTARLPVRLEVMPPDGQSRPVRLSAAWNSVNLSDTGMMVSGEASVPADSSVLFTVALPEGKRDIHGRARVVWDVTAADSRFAMGLEFTGMDDADRSALQAYLQTAHSAAPPA
jgi:c-di-GMP-binding flagellar brake protein YcgR